MGTGPSSKARELASFIDDEPATEQTSMNYYNSQPT